MFKIEYSLDMLRLKSKVNVNDFENFINYYIAIDYDKNELLSRWVSFGYKEYYYQFKINYIAPATGEFNTFWLGYQHNSEKHNHFGNYNLVVEFNPNKIDVAKCPFLFDLLSRFFKTSFTLVSCDLAMDIHGIDISDIYYDKNKKRYIDVRGYGSDKTIYLGKGSGRTKIYNKAKERGLDGLKWTRYEVSPVYNLEINPPFNRCINEINFDSGIELVDIYSLVGTQVDMFSLNGTDRALIYAVQMGYPLEELTRDKRKKIKEYLSNSTAIEIDRKALFGAINRYWDYLYSII